MDFERRGFWVQNITQRSEQGNWIVKLKSWPPILIVVHNISQYIRGHQNLKKIPFYILFNGIECNFQESFAIHLQLEESFELFAPYMKGISATLMDVILRVLSSRIPARPKIGSTVHFQAVHWHGGVAPSPNPPLFYVSHFIFFM